MAETWVLTLDDFLTPVTIMNPITTEIHFISNTMAFTKIRIYEMPDIYNNKHAYSKRLYYYKEDGTYTVVGKYYYADNSFIGQEINTDYLVITFLETPTGDLLTWLQANGVKQIKPANKVVVNGETILDLTQDTVTPATLAKGATAHDKSGAQITGTYVPLDTSDATATASDIVDNKTAYVNGKKVTGELSPRAQIDVGSEEEGRRPNQSQTGMFVEGFCKVSRSILVNSATKVITYIYIPGDATPDSVLEGVTFSSSEYVEATGTMPDNGEASFELSNLAAVDVAEGYYSGGTAKIADAEAAKIIPENIKKGVTILGVEGAMEEGGPYNIAATTNSDGTQNLAITDAGGGSSGSSAGYKVTFPATMTNWDKVARFGFIFVDGTTQKVSSYDSIAGQTIDNVACIIGKPTSTFYVLRMTLTEGAIVQCNVSIESPLDTVHATFAPGVTPTPYGGGASLTWFPIADTVISAIEMYNTD